MLWAIMRGSFALAKTLWVRTETPLRAALLGHEICRKLLEEKARGEALGPTCSPQASPRAKR